MAKPSAIPTDREVQFCELLSQDLPALTIRARMGMTNGAFQGMLGRVRKRLGWQAI